jgi:DNA phosphorothioation-dependent restriction protein DptH
LNRLSPLIDFGFFPDNEAIRFREMLGRSVVLQLHDLPNDRIKQALSEFVIMRLHTLLLRGEQPRALRRMLVFDEAWRVSKNQHLVELGREGGAFGVGLVVSSQFPADVPESLRGNLATKVYLANTDARHRSLVARQLGLLPEDPMLVGLARHEGFVQSSQFSPPCRVRTKPYFERS